MTVVRVAAVQMVSTFDVEANLRSAEQLLTQAADQGASMAVLPENFAVLDSDNLMRWGEEERKTRLFSQFLSPLFNRRTDGYGGSIEARFRIVREVIDEVRRAVGSSFPIGIKINSTDKLVGGLSGDDALAWPLMALGATGVISVIGNLAPQLLQSLVTAAASGDCAAALAYHRDVHDLAAGIGRYGPNPVPIKAAMALAGLIDEDLRLPLCPVDAEARSGIGRVLARHGLLEAAPA